MRLGDLLVEALRQDVHRRPLIDALLVVPESDLGRDLVGERARHDERGVASGAAKVDKTALGEEDDVAAVGEGEEVNLRLDVDVLDGVGLQPRDVDLDIEVTIT